MASRTQSTSLKIAPRQATNSRDTRRLRRDGRVPGVLYGMGAEPMCFSVDARELRHALHAAGAVIELSGNGDKAIAAVLKDAQRHPVRGDVLHVDMLRVDLNKPINAPVALHLVGGEDAPGVREGGVLEHVTREVTVEALPSDIPEALEFSVSEMNINDTATLAQLTAPPAVTIVDDPETVVAILSPPRVEEEPAEELETEVGVVGEGAGEEEGGEEDAGAEEVPADAGDSGGE